MAQLSQESIEEFRELYERHFGKRLSDAEASEKAHRLVGLFRVVYGYKSAAETGKNSK